MLVFFLLGTCLIISTTSYFERPGKTGLQRVLYKLDQEFKFKRAALEEVNMETLILGCTDTVFLICKMGQMSILSFTRNPSYE